VKVKSRGRAYSLVGFSNMLGSYIGMGLIFNLTKFLNPTYSFYIGGCALLIFTLVFAFLIKEPKIKN
jgi:hypothetical protein